MVWLNFSLSCRLSSIKWVNYLMRPGYKLNKMGVSTISDIQNTIITSLLTAYQDVTINKYTSKSIMTRAQSLLRQQLFVIKRLNRSHILGNMNTLQKTLCIIMREIISWSYLALLSARYDTLSMYITQWCTPSISFLFYLHNNPTYK